MFTVVAWLLMVGDEINRRPILSVDAAAGGTMVKIAVEGGSTFLFADNRLVQLTKLRRNIPHDPVK